MFFIRIAKIKLIKCEFNVNEVYAIDMLISTGDGKSRDMDVRTTIYKREPDQVYQLKMKASRGKDYIFNVFMLTSFL